jgi:serine/threonine-protein kinase
MATVTLAEDTLLGRRVALKRVVRTADRQGISRLRREALVGASISHPNLVSIYDVISEEDDVIIVMEYVDGTTLRDSISQNGRLAPGEAVRILKGVAAALDAIHQRGIVHRDVKPPNILLGRNGEVKLADLGIAAAPDRTSITIEGSLLGSFSYMSPEQLEGGSATPAMDIYALSALAYEALGGKRARQEDNPLTLAHAIATRPPPDLTEVWPEAPRAAAALLKRGMSRNPAERPRSAGELVQRLDAALAAAVDPPTSQTTRVVPAVPAPAPAAPATPSPKPPEPLREKPQGRHRKTWVAPALLGLVVLAVLIAVLASSGGTPTQTASTHRTVARHRRSPAKKKAPAKRKAPAKTTAPAEASGPSVPSATPTTSSSPPAAGAAISYPPATSSDAAGAGTPAGATERFYELAASHQYSAAWALADPAFRSQLGGYDSFVSGQSGDRRIIFHQAQVTDQGPSSATVAVRTTSIRDNGTQQCSGTVYTVRSTGTGAWLLHQIAINCS